MNDLSSLGLMMKNLNIMGMMNERVSLLKLAQEAPLG